MPFICLGDRNYPGSDQGIHPEPASQRLQLGRWRIHYQAPTHVIQLEADRTTLILDGYLTGTRSSLDPAALPLGSSPDQSRWILEMIGRHGLEALDQFQGCHVIALIDPAQDQLTVARDLMGGRTAYWHHSEHGMIIASRSSEVAARLPAGPDPDPSFVAACFASGHRYPIGASAFRNVHELLPGETIVFGHGTPERTRTRLVLPSADSLSAQQANRTFLEKLDAATRACLPSDQDCAAMVSGGLDSGPAAVLADRALTKDGKHLKAVSWILPGVPESDESKWIRILGEALQAGVHEFDASQLLPFSRIDDSLVCADYPILNPFRTMIQRCYQWSAEQGCPVILNGNAGDSIYPPRHRLHVDTWRRLGTRVLAADLAWTIRHHGIGGLRRDPAFRGLLRELPGARALLRFIRQPDAQPFPWLTEYARQVLPARPQWPPEAPPSRQPDYFHQLFGPRMIFGRAQEQCFSNCYGVERRDPYHNEGLARFMLTLPYRASHCRATTKNIMRVAIRDLLPEPLRTKSRTGDLDSAFHSGLYTNRKALADFLVRNNHWRAFVQKDHLDRALAQTRPDFQDQHIIAQCLGYSLWLKKLGLA